MSRRRFMIAAVCLLLISVGIGLTLYAFTRSNSSNETAPMLTVIDLGDTKLRFPKGTVLDAGSVPENTPVRFSLPFINDSPVAVDLARFQICKTCFDGARLMESSQQVAPGESGMLEFEMTTGSRAGRQAFGVQVEYATLGPQPETATSPRFTVQLVYANDSPGTCHWEFQTVDFGDVTADAAPSRRISLIQQLRSDLTAQLHLRSESNELVSAKVITEKDAPSMFNLPGTAYEVEIQLHASSGQNGPRREFVIAETPLGDRKLEVQWNSVTDYVLRPANGIFFTSPDTTLAQIVTVRSVRSRAFRILSAACDIPNVEVVVSESSAEAISQTVSLRVPARCPVTSGQLTVRLREPSGDEHEEMLPCRIVSLATEPTPVVAE